MLARDRAHALGPDMSVAMVVVDNATGEILARVASPDYFDERRAGQVDLTQAVRSPGSALKPFIYGLGFEDGLIHPETLIEDRPIRYAGYQPENFDLTFQGTVTVRRALQQSLNVPAVAVLDQVGTEPADRAARRGRRDAGAAAPRGAGSRARPWRRRRAADRPHHALCRVGAAGHRGAAHRTPRRAAVLRRERLIEPVAAWYVGQCAARLAAAGERGRRTDRLQDRHELRLSRRLGDRLRRQAHHRGVDRPARRRAGRRSGGTPLAAPILFDAFARLGQTLAAVAAGAQRRADRDHRQAAAAAAALRLACAAGEAMAPKVHIVFPPNGASLELAGAGEKPDPIAIKIAGGTPPLNVLLNGMPLDAKKTARTLFFAPDGPGFVRLTVTDATGAADSVVVRLQ